VTANRIWIFAAVIGIAAVLGLGYVLGFAPLMVQTATAREQISAVEQTNLAQQNLLAQMQQQFERMDEIEADLAAQRLSVPTELDSDFLLRQLAEAGSKSGVRVERITVGQAQPYGLSADQIASDPGAPVSGEAAFEGLYTVPISIDFAKGTTSEQIMSFAAELQRGPRLLLVTSVSKSSDDGGVAGSLTAYMFVLSHPDDTPGVAGDAYAEALAKFTPRPLTAWGGTGSAVLDPEESPAPEQTPDATETPDPEGTPTP